MERDNDRGSPSTTSRQMMVEGLLERLINGVSRTTRQHLEFVCLNRNLTSTMIEFPLDPSFLGNEPEIDLDLMKYLVRQKLINWCDNTCRLVPLKIRNNAGKTSLLQSIATAIWGLDDDTVESFLQRLVHVILTSGRDNSMMKDRWMSSQNQLNNQFQTKDSWDEVCRAFEENGEEGRHHLDPIHIFSLSNVLRRPILVIGDEEIASPESNQKRMSDLAGIYLPLLCKAEDSEPTPIVLVSHEVGEERGVYPLLIRRDKLERWQMSPFRSVPLVRINQEPFHIRCLLASETKRISDLLQSYLKIAEISSATPYGRFQILSSRLSSEKLPGLHIFPDLSSKGKMKSGQRRSSLKSSTAAHAKTSSEGLLLLDKKKDTLSPNKDDTSCRNEHFPQNAGKRSEFQHLTASDRGQESPATANKTSFPPPPAADCVKCRNTLCRNKGSLRYGGLCSACYIKKEEVEEYSEKPIQLDDVKDAPEFIRGKDGFQPVKEEKNSQKAMDADLEDKLLGNDTHTSTDNRNTSCPAAVANLSDLEKAEDSNESPAPPTDVLTATNQESLTKMEDGRREEEQQAVEKPHHDCHNGQPNTNGDAKCIVDFCDSLGEPSYRGLCADCYNTLVKHRLQKTEEKKSTPLLPPSPPPSSGARPGESAGIHCLTEGCKDHVINRQLGLCLPCLRQQIFAARDLEARRGQKGATKTVRQSHLRGVNLPVPGNEAGDEPLSESNYLGNLTEFRVASERRSAKMCSTANCDRYGDPSFHGFCSLCFKRQKPARPPKH